MKRPIKISEQDKIKFIAKYIEKFEAFDPNVRERGYVHPFKRYIAKQARIELGYSKKYYDGDLGGALYNFFKHNKTTIRQGPFPLSIKHDYGNNRDLSDDEFYYNKWKIENDMIDSDYTGKDTTGGSCGIWFLIIFITLALIIALNIL